MRAALLAALLAVAAADAPGMHNSGTPDGVPDDIDCTVRELAWEFGKKKLPERGDFGLLYDALQLHACPDVARPRASGAWAAPSLAVADGPTYYVATDGDDAGKGTKADPVASIQRGLELAKGQGNATILVRGGTYELESTILVNEDHSGVTIQNYDGENVTVTGGVSFTINAADWTPYNVQETHWETYVDQNNVYSLADAGANNSNADYLGTFDAADECAAAAAAQYLSWTFHGPSFGGDFANQCFGRLGDAWIPKAQKDVYSGRLAGRNTWSAPVPDHVSDIPGLRVDSRRAIRAKYPDGDPEASGDWLEGADQGMGGGDYVYGWVPLGHDTEWVKPAKKPDATELIINAADWPSVNWPMSELPDQDDWTGEGDWGDYHLGMGGYCDDLDPPVGYWCSMEPPRGQCFDNTTDEGAGCTQTHMSPDGVVFPRAAAYKNATGAVVQSWRGGGRWFTQQWRVAGFDAETSTLRFDPATGMQGGEGMTSSGQFWIENVLEECDAPREWYFDSGDRRLYWNPNSTAAPTGDEAFVATKVPVLVNISGSRDTPVQDFSIKGITFVDALHTYLDPHGMPSGGDWALQRNGAITVEGTERLAISDSQFTRVDGNAINVNGYNRDLVIDSNDFSWIGDSCIALWGHTGTCLNENCSKEVPYKVGPDGRGGEQPHHTRISRNVARELGIWQKQSSFVFQAIAYATTISDNVHFNGPRAGINFNDGFAGGDVLEGNLLANCVRESGDHGPFNSWDRVPYIHDFGGADATVIPHFRQIRKNFILSVYSSQEAIDTDDGSAYYNTTQNFMAYGSAGLKSDFGGHDNYHQFNIYPWVSDCWGDGNMDRFIGNTCIANSDDGGFATDCRGLAPYMNVSGNTIYTATGNLSSKLCDPSNVVAGAWPDADTVAKMARDLLDF